MKSDYGYNRISGEEPNKDLLLDFLNELLKDQVGVITTISNLPNEKLPITLGDRRAIFEGVCQNAPLPACGVEKPLKMLMFTHTLRF